MFFYVLPPDGMCFPWDICATNGATDASVFCASRTRLYWKKSRWPDDPVQLEAMRKKIKKVANREYIQEGDVDSLISFFAVPKGKDDIRMVYDATKCGLNEVIWSPNFFLPTGESKKFVDTRCFVSCGFQKRTKEGNRYSQNKQTDRVMVRAGTRARRAR